ncbi:MAG: UDP-N-acetylglucosamine--N-acetylmuramyl-(pentapeptide) pyrophosphoryl-undecaprenol N-acetylglucosamine transferase [Patescibacteria group bacterium]|mgnify:FL=1
MKIVFTGGVTGGHFYPIIAVAEKCAELAEKKKIIDTRFYFFAPTPYNKKMLFENALEWRRVSAGKIRRGFSLLAPIEFLKMFAGIIKAMFSLWVVYPDVVFGKGGYGSFPTLFAAKILRIPVIIHESDSAPGRVNVWAAKFASRIALSYTEAAAYFPKEKIAFTGQPIRGEIMTPIKNGAFEYLHLEPSVPVILFLSGSQGARIINDVILNSLPDLVLRYQIIHQTGELNLAEVMQTAGVVLENNQHKNRYKAFGYLNDLAMKMSSGAASLIISRAGSTIFEIAAWGIPSIIIPITDSNGDHQRKNAFNYARSGAAVVVEERNLTPHILISEINKIMENKNELEKMRNATRAFYKPDAAEKIAEEILSIALDHESR